MPSINLTNRVRSEIIEIPVSKRLRGLQYSDEELIIWNCLINIFEVDNYNQFRNRIDKRYFFIKEFFQRYSGLRDIANDAISRNLTMIIYPYIEKFRGYGDPTRSPSAMISNPFIFGVKIDQIMEIFEMIIKDNVIMGYMKDLSPILNDIHYQ